MKVGVFESFRTFGDGELWRFEDHWCRWQESASSCGIQIPVDLETVWEQLNIIPADKKVRLWTDGDLWRLEVSELPEAPESVIVRDATYQRQNPQAKHDQHDYHQFYDSRCFETIWFDEQDRLLEGNITNVFAVIDGVICTPPTDKILPGLMRQWVLDHFSAEVRPVYRDQLMAATEIFLTNMVRGVVAVDQWGNWRSSDRTITSKITDQLRQSQPQ